ncbi:MAG: type II toxin-antitoxin system RatA family toxin [Rhodospirillaceae bacterium]|nr:type II toxin-antitoxin system RatA family toxin [Rhodospirillaceae bacterium]
MPKHQETKILPYTPEQMFDLVADVKRYPGFLPWVTGARIRQQSDTLIVADLLVGFKMIRERFTSQVTLSKPDRIDVAYTKGPFRHLENHWIFRPHPKVCEIEFYLDFEFNSRLLQKLIGALFNEAVRKMVSAFESRARKLYGDSTAKADPAPGSPTEYLA